MSKVKFNKFYILYIYVQDKGNKEMATQSTTEDMNKKLAEIYSEKLTVNLEAKSTLSPDDFWKSMDIIAGTNKALMNYRVVPQ